MEFLECDEVVVSASTGNGIIRLPTVPDQGLVAMIWKVDFQVSLSITVSSEGCICFALARREGSYYMADPMVLCSGRLEAASVDAVARPGMMMLQGGQHYFDPPIPIARPAIWAVFTSALNAQGSCKVGYTLEKVTDSVLLRALIE